MKSFEEVVNREFLEKYSGRIKEEYLPIGEDGKADLSVLKTVFNMTEGGNNPNRFTYASIYGINDLVSSWNVPGRYKGKTEVLYGECLEEGVRWEKKLGYKGVSEDEIL